MPDITTAAIRRRMMAAIGATNTQPERAVGSALHRSGFRFRKNVRGIPGRPDLVLRKHNAVIFVHGCFWHGHQCRYFRWPKTRELFWRTKIMANRKRDRMQQARLLRSGWRVALIWECVIRDGKPEFLARRLSNWINGKRKTLELAL